MVVSLARSEDAFVVVGELDQVYSVSLAVVGVYFLSSLKVVEAD